MMYPPDVFRTASHNDMIIPAPHGSSPIVHRSFSCPFVHFVVTLLFPFAIHAAELQVRVFNAPEQGTLVFELYDSPSAFGNLRGPAWTSTFPADGREVYVLEDIPDGELALLVFHDENGDGLLDRNFIGIPREGIGLSNRYRPKGPPSFVRARFTPEQGVASDVDVEMYRALGRRGRIGVGVGIIARSSPYRDYDGGVYQPIPTITYIGKRFQILGPSLNISLVGSGKLRLAATASYRMGVYEEDESPYLEGMGDRKDTALAGLAFQWDLPGGVDFAAQYEHDILDQIGGGEARLRLNRGIQWKVLRFGPSLGATMLSAEMSNHDYGVPVEKATPERPAYELDETFSVEAGLGVSIEIAPKVHVYANGAVEWLSDDVTGSPIVEDDYVLKGFGAVTYVF